MNRMAQRHSLGAPVQPGSGSPRGRVQFGEAGVCMLPYGGSQHPFAPPDSACDPVRLMAPMVGRIMPHAPTLLLFRFHVGGNVYEVAGGGVHALDERNDGACFTVESLLHSLIARTTTALAIAHPIRLSRERVRRRNRIVCATRFRDSIRGRSQPDPADCAGLVVATRTALARWTPSQRHVRGSCDGDIRTRRHVERALTALAAPESWPVVAGGFSARMAETMSVSRQ